MQMEDMKRKKIFLKLSYSVCKLKNNTDTHSEKKPFYRFYVLAMQTISYLLLRHFFLCRRAEFVLHNNNKKLQAIKSTIFSLTLNSRLFFSFSFCLHNFFSRITNSHRLKLMAYIYFCNIEQISYWYNNMVLLNDILLLFDLEKRIFIFKSSQ